MPQFETGAVRSNDAENEAWYLISPIAWYRLAAIYSKHLPRLVRGEIHLNLCIENIIDYLAGKRNDDPLATALFHLFEYIHLEKTQKNTYSGLVSVYKYRFDLISPIGLRRIAERYRLGEKKYSAYNCEKGMPVHDLLNHAIRHIEMHIEGREDEPGDDNLGGVAWGLCMAMHSEEKWPEINRGHLRGPNCSITEDIEHKIIEHMKDKITKED